MPLIQDTPTMLYIRGISEAEAQAFLEIKNIFRLTSNAETVKKCFIEFVKLYKEN